jgi:hypothetical protein
MPALQMRECFLSHEPGLHHLNSRKQPLDLIRPQTDAPPCAKASCAACSHFLTPSQIRKDANQIAVINPAEESMIGWPLEGTIAEIRRFFIAANGVVYEPI